jgi:hypothetical protein
VLLLAMVLLAIRWGITTQDRFICSPGPSSSPLYYHHPQDQLLTLLSNYMKLKALAQSYIFLAWQLPGHVLLPSVTKSESMYYAPLGCLHALGTTTIHRVATANAAFQLH